MKITLFNLTEQVIDETTLDDNPCYNVYDFLRGDYKLAPTVILLSDQYTDIELTEQIVTKGLDNGSLVEIAMLDAHQPLKQTFHRDGLSVCLINPRFLNNYFLRKQGELLC